jgi:hypothetical protein
VVVTNKTIAARHRRGPPPRSRPTRGGLGRAEVPRVRWTISPREPCLATQSYPFAAVLAHNLNRDAASTPQRTTTEKQAALWLFEQLAPVRLDSFSVPATT